MNIYGYVRVSSMDQNERRQMDALKSTDVNIKNIYIYTYILSHLFDSHQDK